MKFLKKSVMCVALNVALYGFLTNTALAWSSGPPAYRTGAPGDNGTCNADVIIHTVLIQEAQVSRLLRRLLITPVRPSK